MTLRLVLVSLVAGLGLGIPAWPTIEVCVGSAQTWMNARLADLDARRGENKKYVLIHDLLTEEMGRARAAAARRAEAAYADVLGSDAPALAMAAEHVLPKLDDFLRSVQADAADAPAPTPADDAPAVVRPDELARMAWDQFGPGGAELVETFAQGVREAALLDAQAAEFAALESSEDLYFDGDFTLEAVSEPVLAAETETAHEAVNVAETETAPLPGFEALEQSANLYFADPIADETTPAAEALADLSTPTPPPAPAEDAAELAMLPDDVFAPEEPAIPVEADAIAAIEPAANDEAGPVLEAAGPVEAVMEPVVSADMNRAVRLTREALSAWVNVLTGPAVVTITQRSVASPR